MWVCVCARICVCFCVRPCVCVSWWLGQAPVLIWRTPRCPLSTAAINQSVIIELCWEFYTCTLLNTHRHWRKPGTKKKQKQSSLVPFQSHTTNLQCPPSTTQRHKTNIVSIWGPQRRRVDKEPKECTCRVFLHPLLSPWPPGRPSMGH